jgi:succinate dehydrogenase / fumarate reductase iron-sulfur subunit
MMESNESAAKTVLFEVLRYNPDRDKSPAMQRYQVPLQKGMTVLDGLVWIKENLDASLSWRSSCRMGVCGSCGMFINGLPRLACNNQIVHINSEKITVKPLPNFDIIRDLVPDLDGFFQKHRSVKPYLIRKEIDELDHPTGEYFQSPEDLVNYIQFAYCIKCGLCLSACPTVATDERYTGPQALAQALRYNSDSRDEGAKEREMAVYSGSGVWRCHFAGACSDVCPKGVDPAMAIQLLKRDILLKKLQLRKYQHGTGVLPKTEEWKENPKIPKAPEPTV